MRKTIKGFNQAYSVDIYGNIYRGNKIIKSYNNGIGYFQVKLALNGKRYNKYIHRIVWETFVGEIPKGYEINHIDHDKSNNCLYNLELVTHSENIHKAFIKYGYFGSMNKPKNMLTLSQAEGTPSEGAETTGEV